MVTRHIGAWLWVVAIGYRDLRKPNDTQWNCSGFVYDEITEFIGPPNTVLMKDQIPVANNAEYRKAYAIKIDDTVLCAGYPEGGKNTCMGDSGAPLMFPKGTQYYLMGISSYGPMMACRESNHPSVYTNVPSFVDWIVKKVNEN